LAALVEPAEHEATKKKTTAKQAWSGTHDIAGFRSLSERNQADDIRQHSQSLADDIKHGKKIKQWRIQGEGQTLTRTMYMHNIPVK